MLMMTHRKHRPTANRHDPPQEDVRLDQRYGKVGIPAVEAALHFPSDSKNPHHVPPLPKTPMRIKRHDRSHAVELADGSLWRIWPGDVELTLKWLPATELQVRQIEDPLCTHALVDPSEGTSVRVIEGQADWPVEQVQRALKKG
jgi:hypothetical protein